MKSGRLFRGGMFVWAVLAVLFPCTRAMAFNEALFNAALNRYDLTALAQMGRPQFDAYTRELNRWRGDISRDPSLTKDDRTRLLDKVDAKLKDLTSLAEARKTDLDLEMERVRKTQGVGVQRQTTDPVQQLNQKAQ